jgi:hypothetical protein
MSNEFDLSVVKCTLYVFECNWSKEILKNEKVKWPFSKNLCKWSNDPFSQSTYDDFLVHNVQTIG